MKDRGARKKTRCTCVIVSLYVSEIFCLPVFFFLVLGLYAQYLFSFPPLLLTFSFVMAQVKLNGCVTSGIIESGVVAKCVELHSAYRRFLSTLKLSRGINESY